MTRVCARDGCDKPTKDDYRAKWCSDNCRKRQWDEDHRKRCECGVLLAARSDGARCLACRRAADAERHEALLARVERMWADGMDYAAISAAVGRKYLPGGKSCSLASVIHELRQQGRAPYRYRVKDGRRVAA